MFLQLGTGGAGETGRFTVKKHHSERTVTSTVGGTTGFTWCR